jgi:hypothetical protein
MLSVRPLAGLVLGLALLGAATARAAGDWNDKEINWQPYSDGLAAAKKDRKPICLVFYTTWCPHCGNYSGVFHDPKVVDMAKKFVMIRLDNDKEKELSQKYAPDGSYIPRTFFLSSAGQLDADIKAPRDKFQYFYDERSPDSVLGGMNAALKKLH